MQRTYEVSMQDDEEAVSSGDENDFDGPPDSMSEVRASDFPDDDDVLDPKYEDPEDFKDVGDQSEPLFISSELEALWDPQTKKYRFTDECERGDVMRVLHNANLHNRLKPGDEGFKSPHLVLMQFPWLPSQKQLLDEREQSGDTPVLNETFFKELYKAVDRRVPTKIATANAASVAAQRRVKSEPGLLSARQREMREAAEAAAQQALAEAHEQNEGALGLQQTTAEGFLHMGAGRCGTIRIYSSGRVEFDLAGLRFLASTAMPSWCMEQCMAFEKQKAYVLQEGALPRIVCTLDVDQFAPEHQTAQRD